MRQKVFYHVEVRQSFVVNKDHWYFRSEHTSKKAAEKAAKKAALDGYWARVIKCSFVSVFTPSKEKLS